MSSLNMFTQLSNGAICLLFLLKGAICLNVYRKGLGASSDPLLLAYDLDPYYVKIAADNTNSLHFFLAG